MTPTFLAHCLTCGQPTDLNEIGHRCSNPDPRIMAELRAIRQMLTEFLKEEPLAVD